MNNERYIYIRLTDSAYAEYIHVCMYVCIYILFMYVRTCSYANVCICMYVRVLYAYVYVYKMYTRMYDIYKGSL